MTIEELEILRTVIAGLTSLAHDNKKEAGEDLFRALRQINYLIHKKYREEGER